jgi:hypothetical protein
MIERIAKETTMDSTGAYQDSGQAELKKRITRYKALARQIRDPVTVQSVKSLIAELEQTLSRIDDK